MDMDKVRRIGVSVRPFVHVRIGNFAGHRKIRGFGDLEALSYERPPAASRVSVKGDYAVLFKKRMYEAPTRSYCRFKGSAPDHVRHSTAKGVDSGS